jgi:glucose/mannose-6-phosphate isomerase
MLDDRVAIRKVDQSDMLSVMERTPDRLVPPPGAESTCRLDIEKPLNIVFAGVGGSGIVGDILTDYLRETIRTPAVVCRSVKIPKFVGENTFLVAISYSGETRETLEMFEESMRAKAEIAVVCSGGRLLDAAETHGISYVKVAAGMIPRVALPELVSAVTHVLGKAGILEDSDRLLDLASKATRDVIGGVRAAVPLAQNQAKQVATALMGHLPLLVGSEQNVSVLRRFKNELNENSKVPAVFYTLPEAFHDDVEGLRALVQLTQPQPVILRGASETEGERRVRESLVDAFSQLEFPKPLFFGGVGNGRYEWLLSAITFGDFVSLYLSALRGVDPSKLSWIPQFRAIRGQVGI